MPGASEIAAIGTKRRQVRLRKDEDVGLCISCGHKITLCGIGFTADIVCSKCHIINQFRESKQPVGNGGVASNG